MNHHVRHRYIDAHAFFHVGELFNRIGAIPHRQYRCQENLMAELAGSGFFSRNKYYFAGWAVGAAWPGTGNPGMANICDKALGSKGLKPVVP